MPQSRELPADVIARARAGDRDARREVLLRYAGPLNGLIRRAQPGGDADDLSQDLLHRLLVALPRFDPAGTASFTTWVFQVAHHFLIDLHRKRRLELVPLTEARAVRDAGEDPSAAAHRSEVRGSLEAAIAALPVEQRRIFVLAHVYEQPLQAVADAEGLPVGTVKSRLFRARAQLAAVLATALGEGGLP